MKKFSVVLLVFLPTQCYSTLFDSLSGSFNLPQFGQGPTFSEDFKIGTEYVDDRCDFYNPIVPDFSRPGQRISVTKCYEYMWEIQVRMDRDWKCNAPSILRKAFEHKTHLVINGTLATPKQFPHIGAVGWRSAEPGRLWKFMCGCTLISSKFVVTAAHCTSAAPDTAIADVVPKIVRFGDKNINDRTREDHNIARIIVHPQYASPAKYYDIALFELEGIVEFTSYLQPSCLWTEELDKVPKQNATTVAGWGVTASGAREGSPDLLFAPLNIIDSELCDALHERNRHWHGLEDHQFCAGRLEGGIDTCQGDSGGPFQVEIPLPKKIKDETTMHYIVGVTSFGKKCAQENLPGVYTKISYFADWIEQHVWG